MSNLVFLSASQLAIVMQERQVSALEVLEAHLGQITQHNSAMNAIATTRTAAKAPSVAATRSFLLDWLL